ncbi:hypothetical protein [Nitratireductor rhodophyticola]|uniref:hypothetical protein n=1 Tax=Nitratireductor rhodophyticola TaxID=2854036 RepID=UPI003BA8D1F3
MHIDINLVKALNSAINGRLFCVLLFCANMILFAVIRDIVFAHMMLLAAAIVGVSCLAERGGGRAGILQVFLSLLVTGLSITALAITFIATLMIG